MLRNGIVKLWSNALDLRQATTRNGWKVVMFIVVADIEGDKVQRTVVRVRLETLEEKEKKI